MVSDSLWEILFPPLVSFLSKNKYFCYFFLNLSLEIDNDTIKERNAIDPVEIRHTSLQNPDFFLQNYRSILFLFFDNNMYHLMVK